MVSRDRIVASLDAYLDVDRYRDYAPIGLQVEGHPVVKRITLGVSACIELFEQAAADGSQMVIVHHGMFWKKESRVLKGSLKRRVRFLLDRDMSLLGYHLPLDAHPVVGNNARIIRILGASRGRAFGVYDGMDIGWVGTFRTPQPLAAVARKLKKLTPSDPMIFAHGPKKIKRFGVVSGGAGGVFVQAVDEGLDLYITGEPYEPAQAICRESGINFMALGHHNSEKTGVEALAGWLRRKFRIPAEFVDIPNPA